MFKTYHSPASSTVALAMEGEALQEFDICTGRPCVSGYLSEYIQQAIGQFNKYLPVFFIDLF